MSGDDLASRAFFFSALHFDPKKKQLTQKSTQFFKPIKSVTVTLTFSSCDKIVTR